MSTLLLHIGVLAREPAVYCSEHVDCQEPWCTLVPHFPTAVTPVNFIARVVEDPRLHAGPGRGELLVRLLAEAGRNSSEFRGRLLRFDGPVREGFFVRALQVMALGAFCAYHGCRLYIGPGNRADTYFSPERGESAWEQFFEPVGHVPLEQIIAPPGCICQLSCSAVKRLLFRISRGINGNIYPRHWKAERQRMLGAAAVDAFVRPNSMVLSAAQEEWDKLMTKWKAGAAVEQQVVVLGVHMRGTDKVAGIGGAKVGPSQYSPVIEKFVTHVQSRGMRPAVFLATDDQDFADRLLSLHASIVQQQGGGNVLRSVEAGVPIWGRRANFSENFRRGLEVLLDSLLLSRCDYLLKPNSAVSEFAIYLSPHLINRSIDLQFPTAAWNKVPFLTNETSDDALSPMAEGLASPSAASSKRPEPTWRSFEARRSVPSPTSGTPSHTTRSNTASAAYVDMCLLRSSPLSADTIRNPTSVQTEQGVLYLWAATRAQVGEPASRSAKVYVQGNGEFSYHDRQLKLPPMRASDLCSGPDNRLLSAGLETSFSVNETAPEAATSAPCSSINDTDALREAWCDLVLKQAHNVSGSISNKWKRLRYFLSAMHYMCSSRHIREEKTCCLRARARGVYNFARAFLVLGA